MQKIIGKEKPLSDLLSNKKYTIHYYQREYRWGKKQIEELIDDLAGEFYESYENTIPEKKFGNTGIIILVLLF